MRFLSPVVKLLGASLVFAAWLASTIFHDRSQQAEEQFTRINTELTALQQYSTLATEHQQSSKDLASITRMFTALPYDSSSIVDRISNLALLQSLSAQVKTVSNVHYTATHLVDLSEFLGRSSTLKDSVTAVAASILNLQNQQNQYVDSVRVLLAESLSESPKFRALYNGIVSRQWSFQILEDQSEGDLIHLYARVADEAKKNAQRAGVKATRWSVISAILFAIGTVLLLLHDFAETRSKASAAHGSPP